MKALIAPAARYTQAAMFSALITFSLFFLMQMLVAGKDYVQLDDKHGTVVDIYEAKPLDKEVTPKEIIEDVEPPVIAPLPDFFPEAPTHGGTPVFIQPDIETGKSGLAPTNSGVVGWMKITPAYPTRPLRDGIEGYAILEFTVGKDGKVRDIRVLDESPKGYGFARASVKAAEKFKYNPRVVNGKALATTGIREKFEFTLEDGK